MSIEDAFDVLKWWAKIRANPGRAVVGIVALTIVAGIAAWSNGKIGAFMDRTCAFVHVCSSEKSDEPFNITFSTQTPHCQIGNLTQKFHDWPVTVSLEGGADRLVVCTDLTLHGTRAEQAELLGALGAGLPECLTVDQTGDPVVVRANLDSAAICRAPYRFDDLNLVEATMAQGLFVCMPGHRQAQTTDFFEQYGKRIYQCDEQSLRDYKFR